MLITAEGETAPLTSDADDWYLKVLNSYGSTCGPHVTNATELGPMREPRECGKENHAKANAKTTLHKTVFKE